ncbi:MAG: hypothetical protein IIY46_03095 [Lachnospiraceae bacterium]|nr:hypothetical protein [Lachnospiraceae bacterium]
MADLYTAPFEDNGAKRWGLFYEDAGGRRHLTEDFRSLAFDTAEEAEHKLRLIEDERKSEDKAVPFSPEEAEAFAGRCRWKFASTYAKTAPHEYLLKRRLPEEDRRLFERLVQTINERSVTGYFYGHRNNYLILGSHYYWYMPGYPDNMAVDLINRTTVDHLEYRDGAYYYRPKKG